MITANLITDGICTALSTTFEDGYEIYTEDIQQGLQEPCFSVRCVSPSMNQFLGKRYFKSYLFCVHYFPKSENETKEEAQDVLEQLFETLEYITVDGDLVRGTGMHGELIDGVLNFFVTYAGFVYKEEDPILMETLEQIIDAKG